MSTDKKTFVEEIEVTAENLADSVKNLIHEGNVRHIVVKNPDGHTIMEIPVSVGVIGALLAPMLAAVAAIAVYAANFKVEVTRDAPPVS